MAQLRRIICPVCGNANDEGNACWKCGHPIELASNDYQDVVFWRIDDGYHSWYSQPTSIHTRYRCKNHPLACRGCAHYSSADTLCHSGVVDIRRMRRERYDGTVEYHYKDWVDTETPVRRKHVENSRT